MYDMKNQSVLFQPLSVAEPQDVCHVFTFALAAMREENADLMRLYAEVELGTFLSSLHDSTIQVHNRSLPVDLTHSDDLGEHTLSEAWS